jgi:hypothetical protein
MEDTIKEDIKSHVYDYGLVFENEIYGRIVSKAAERDIAFDNADRLHIHVREVLIDEPNGNNGAFVIAMYEDWEKDPYSLPELLAEEGPKTVMRPTVGYSSGRGLKPVFGKLMNETRDLRVGRGGR